MERDKYGNFNCKKCSGIFFTKVGFKIHLSRQCSIKFEAQNNVHKDASNLPQDEMALQPNECKKSNNGNKTPYQCQECPKIYELQRHVNIVHENLKPFQCQQCDDSFGYKNTFQTHVNNVHRKLTS